MSRYVGVKQKSDSDDLNVSLNDTGQIIIEHDCDDYHTPYVLIDIDRWEQVKSAVDKLLDKD